MLKRIPGYDPFATKGDCEFYPDAAQEVLDFIPECCRHVKGEWAGQPLVLEPWQTAIVANLFGWKRPDGTRRYREAFVFVPRKNGKTVLSASLVLWMLFGDGEPGAEIYSSAADRDQAALIFAQAKGMVEQEPELERRSTIYQTSKSIVFGNSSYKAISAEAATKHGYNSHCVINDELHAQPNRDLIDVLATGMGSRRQPLTIHITTSDFDRESICNEKHKYACKVRDGTLEKPDPSFLPVIYEASRDDDWTDPKVWAKANPNLEVSVKLEYLERECKRAQETPTYENTFKRLHLNIRTEQDVRWLSMDQWDKCGGDVDPSALKGEQCFAGLDLATTTDIAALVLYFPKSGAVLPFFWVPADNAEKREKRDRVPYVTWARQGYIELTPGNVCDYEYIRKRVNELGKVYNIREIAIDRWNSTQLQTQLMGDGFEVVPFGQGFGDMAAPTKELERLVITGGATVGWGGIRHGGNPVLRWMASNVTVETDAAGNLKPSKRKSTERIDGIVALTMAIGRAMVTEEAKPSVWERHGVRSV